MNAPALYVLSELMAKALLLIDVATPNGSTGNLKGVIYERVFRDMAFGITASLAFALSYIAAEDSDQGMRL